MAFCKFFHLIPTFLLSPSNNFQLSLPSFCKPLPNPHEAIAAFQLVLKSPIVLCILNSLYYTPAETAATDEAIAAAMPKFVIKITDNENKYLRCYTVCLIDNLELLQSSYLKEYNLTSIAPIVKFPEQTCIIGELFNNFLPAGQVQIMYVILDKEKTRLYAMIKAILEQINIILQEQKSLRA